MYNTEVLSEKYFKIFMGAYNDFRVKCREDYRFELDPLTYDDFMENELPDRNGKNEGEIQLF